MKITFQKDILEAAVNDSLCAVSEKNTYPALEGIRFKCEAGGLCSLTTFDLNKGFYTEIPCECSVGGNYIIAAAKLNRIIKFLPDRDVYIEIDAKNVVWIKSGKAKFEMHALDGESFPNLPDLNGDTGFSVKGSLIKKVIGQIYFAIAVTDQRPMLCGAMFNIKGNTMKVVSCDGNRLAIREIESDITNQNDGELELSFIIPGKTLSQLVRLIEDSDEKISISLGRKHVIFTLKDKTFFSRLIDSEYIDYQRVIPKDPKIFVKVNRMQLISSLERASLVTEEKALGQVKSCVKCNFSESILNISSNSVTGSFYDEVPIEKTGDDLLIGFNCRYLLDALKSADGEYVGISMTTALMSIIIEQADDEKSNETRDEAADSDGDEKSKYLYMVCPIRMN